MNLAPNRHVAFVAALLASLGLSANALGYGKQNQQQQNRNNNTQKNDMPPKQTVAIPTVDASGVAAAKKEVAAAKAEEKKALNALNQVRSKLMKGFDTKPEVAEAAKRVATTKAAYDAAAAPVVKSVESSASYKSGVATASKAEAQVAALRGNTEATPKQRMDAARQALDARNALTQTRADALASDAKVAAAKKDYDEATAALAKIRQELEASIQDDAELASAEQALEDAKAKTKEADEKVAAANKELAAQNAKRLAAIDEQRRIDREYAAQQRSNKGKKKW